MVGGDSGKRGSGYSDVPLACLPPYRPVRPLLFVSFRFVIFLVLTLLGDRLLFSWPSARKAWLLVASLLFYSAMEPVWLVLLLVSIVVDYLVGIGLGQAKTIFSRRFLLGCSVVINLGLLGCFKYGDMILVSLEDVSSLLGVPISLPRIPGGLPVGISFYTFQTLNYSLDRYNGKVPAARSLLDFSLFVSFFPQLVAGPIVRARDFLPQLVQAPVMGASAVGQGLGLMLIGIVKKALIADNLRALVVSGFEQGESGPIGTIIGIFGSYVALYYDFSGYTDLALGTALLFGFRLPENFDRPGLARSPMEHWRRWHMTLNQLLHEAIFVPLGGNSGGARTVVFAGFATFVLAGAWHGAAWSYVVMGIYNGLLVALWRAVRPRPSQNPMIARLEGALAIFLVALSLVFMRPQPLATGVDLLDGLWDIEHFSSGIPGWLGLGLLFGAIAVHTTPPQWKRQLLDAAGRAPAFTLALVTLIIAGLVSRASENAADFTYFQF